MAQTVYNQDRAVAVAGQRGDAYLGEDVTGFPAGEVIPAGRMCEVVSGLLRLAQSTGDGSTDALAGISLYDGFQNYQGAYQIGDMVPCLRKGRVWVDVSSTMTGATELEIAKYTHSSTIATDRGKFTDAAASASAGVEIATFSGKFRNRPAGATGATGLVQVEINLP